MVYLHLLGHPEADLIECVRGSQANKNTHSKDELLVLGELSAIECD